MADTSRVFVALPLDPGLAERVGEVQSVLRRRIEVGAVRWVRPSQLHVTLRFLGEVEAVRLPDLRRAVAAACVGRREFRLRVEGFGAFPHLRSPRVLWLGLQGELARLADLQGALATTTRDFAAHREPERFSPHLTLGRVNDRGRRDVSGTAAVLADFQFVDRWDWPIREVRLLRSQLQPSGSVYTNLGGFPLRSASDNPTTNRSPPVGRANPT